MIYEMRTCNCLPGKAPELLERIGEIYEHRAKYSEVAGFWYTDIGPLHQVVHIWPYESPDVRLRARAEAGKDEHWPPDVHGLLVDMQSEIYAPAPFCPELRTGELGLLCTHIWCGTNVTVCHVTRCFSVPGLRRQRQIECQVGR